MTTFRRCTTLVLIILSLLVPLRSQGQQNKLLTVQDAVTLALERNKELRTVRLDVDKADAQVRQAWGYALPALDFSGRYTNTLKKPVFFLPDFENPSSGRIQPVAIGSNHAFDLSVTGRQTIFDATVFIGVGAAGTYSEAAREVYRSKEVETVTNVRKAYYRVLLARAVYKLVSTNVANAEENLQNAQALFKEGLLPEYDVLRATVGVENLRPSLIQAQNNVDLATNGLRIAIGLDMSDEFQLEDSLVYDKVPEELMAAAEATIGEVNLSLRALRLQAEVNRAFMRAARSDYLPRLYAFGTYQYQAAKNSFAFAGSDFINSSQVGLQLTMSIFSGFQTNAQVDQAEIDMMKTQEQADNLEMNLKTLARSIVSQLHEAQQRIEAQQKTVEQAERGYRIASTRFRTGLGTQLEVNDAQAALTQARVNWIQAQYDYAVAGADFDQALGRLPQYVTSAIEKD